MVLSPPEDSKDHGRKRVQCQCSMRSSPTLSLHVNSECANEFPEITYDLQPLPV